MQVETRRAPGPGALAFFWRRMRMGMRSSLGSLVDDTNAYGDVVRFQFLGAVFHVLRHPDHVRHVLEAHHLNYRRARQRGLLKPLLGDGLLTSDGALWKRQRRLMQPAFSNEALRRLEPAMAGEIAAFTGGWREGEVNVADEMMRLALSIAGRTMFGVEVGETAALVKQAFHVTLEDFQRRRRAVASFPLWVPTPRNRTVRAALDDLDRVVFSIIERRRGRKGEGDLLDLLMAAREADEAMTDAQLRDEVMTLLLAGHETTANLLTWTWYLLATHPEVERRLHEELDRVLGGRAARAADLPALGYTHQVLLESLRLYPPAWIFLRQAVERDVIGGFEIPPGSVVILSPYLTQRHPAFWPEPERFDPERFAAGAGDHRPRHAYIPFGGGPRQCIGNTFALMEAQLVLATIGAQWRLALSPRHRIAIETALTLRPGPDSWMRLERRDAPAPR